MNDQGIIDRINSVLKLLKMTANSFAVKAEIDPSNFQKMLVGKQKITIKTISKISKLHKINENWLLTGEGAMLKEPDNVREVVQTNERGDNLYESEKTVGGSADETLRDVILRQSQQIDRLLSIIERMQGIK